MNALHSSKKLLIALVLLISIVTPSFCKDKIKIGYFDLKPHTIFENNTHSGGIVEFWEKFLAPAMDVEIEWSGPLPPVRLFDALDKGEINAIALLAKNADRVAKYDFPAEPFFLMKAGVAVLKDNKLAAVSGPSSLFGMTLGFFKDGFIPPSLKDDKIKWDLVSDTDWQTLNFNKLISKRIDAAFNPESLSLDYVAKKMGLADKIKTLIVPDTTSELYSVFTKKDNGKFLNKYNAAIAKKSIKELYQTYVGKYL